MKKVLSCLLVAIACTPLAASAQGVYRCGNSYQSQPCSSDAGREVKIQTGNNATAGAASSKGGLSEAAFNRCYIKNEACKGMSTNQLERSFGKPNKINASTGSYGYHEQRIYYKGDDEFLVYTENGIVTTIQHQPGSAAIFAPSLNRPSKNCPSALEIRNAEVSANSIALSDYDRREKLRQITDMKRCAMNE